MKTIFSPVASDPSNPTPGRVGVSSVGAAGVLSSAQTMNPIEPTPGSAEAVAGTLYAQAERASDDSDATTVQNARVGYVQNQKAGTFPATLCGGNPGKRPGEETSEHSQAGPQTVTRPTSDDPSSRGSVRPAAQFSNQRVCRCCGTTWSRGRWDTSHVCPECARAEWLEANTTEH